MISAVLAGRGLKTAAEDGRLPERLEARRITPDSVIPRREFLFLLYGTPCFPRGELVALTGKEKSGKTFVVSMLLALCVKGEVLRFARCGTDVLRAVWYDTEQSEESTKEILVERIGRMVGSGDLFSPAWHESLSVFNVRSESWRERMPLLEAAVRAVKPDLVVVDGIRDLVDDINDGVLSQDVAERLMHLASECNCCIVCVLHQNKAADDRNLRGWIGTELAYKAFEVYECVKDSDRTMSLRQVRTRKFDIEGKMAYNVAADGLPVEYGQGWLTESVPRRGTMMGRTEFNPKYTVSSGDSGCEIDYRTLFADCMPDRDAVYGAMQLRSSVMSAAGIVSPFLYNKLKHKALADGTIKAVRSADGKRVMFCRQAD